MLQDQLKSTQRDLSKLDMFKRSILQSIQDEEVGGVPGAVLGAGLGLGSGPPPPVAEYTPAPPSLAPTPGVGPATPAIPTSANPLGGGSAAASAADNGAFGLAGSESESWHAAAAACLAKCAKCERCRYVTISLEFRSPTSLTVS